MTFLKANQTFWNVSSDQNINGIPGPGSSGRIAEKIRDIAYLIAYSSHLQTRGFHNAYS